MRMPANPAEPGCGTATTGSRKGWRWPLAVQCPVPGRVAVVLAASVADQREGELGAIALGLPDGEPSQWPARCAGQPQTAAHFCGDNFTPQAGGARNRHVLLMCSSC
jgi:hypothetical protein